MGNILDSSHYAKVLNLCIGRIAHLTGYVRDLPDNRLVARRVADYEAVELRQAVRDLDTAVTDFLDSNQAVWQAKSPSGDYWFECDDEKEARDYEQQGFQVRALYPRPIDAQALSDAKCEAVYDAVTRANLTRDVKSPEHKREIVRTALLATPPAAKPEQGEPVSHEQVAEFLHSIGWRSPLDAQWHNLRDAMPELMEKLRYSAQPKPAGEASSAEAPSYTLSGLITYGTIAADRAQGATPEYMRLLIQQMLPHLKRLSELAKPSGEAVDAEALAKLASAKPKYTYGHCPHKQLMGGCPFPNVQCNYPDCDRRLSTNGEAVDAEDAARYRWLRTQYRGVEVHRNLFSSKQAFDGWVDARRLSDREDT